jgi:hypothetical protein
MPAPNWRKQRRDPTGQQKPRAGDANLDGFISGDDYSVIDFTILAQRAPP